MSVTKFKYKNIYNSRHYERIIKSIQCEGYYIFNSESIGEKGCIFMCKEDKLEKEMFYE
jgi:hypothetical protein